MIYKRYNDWVNTPVLTDIEKEKLDKMKDKPQEIEAAFQGELKFGTSGLRGIMGLGTNRMNQYTVRKASQGLADYICTKGYKEPSIVIGYDSRLNSRKFACDAATVFCDSGIKAYMFDQCMPVPLLSFAVKELGAAAGVMITASHNPKEYNGYKVYNHTGGQILDAEAEEIQKAIADVDLFAVSQKAFSEDMANFSYVEETVYEKYKEKLDNAVNTVNKDSDYKIKIVYTPLNGAGRKPVEEMFERCGFDFETVQEQQEANGEFPTCPYPNPEKIEVYKLAIELAEKNNADLIIATDPDCDRVGAVVKHKDGENEEYVLLTGNETGIILANYIFETAKIKEGDFMCTSLVSTPLVNLIAEEHGVDVKRTLVGFKYIAEYIEKHPENALYGFEESNGCIAGSYTRDKDGVLGAKLLAEVTDHYHKKGMSLIDGLHEIYKKHKYVVDKTINYDISSADQGGEIMKAIRDVAQRRELLDNEIEFVDYKNPEMNRDLPLANMVMMNLEDGARIIVRPSGTEPKVKVYLSVLGDSRKECKDTVKKYEKKFKEFIEKF